MEDTIEYKGYTIEIIRDEFPVNPRTDYEQYSEMVCFHSRYNIGDEHDYNPEELEEYLQSEEIEAYLPIYLYDHSSITISTTPFSCRWDSGQIGYIFITKNKYKETGSTCKAIDILKGEVDTYDNYLTGEVYGYEITHKDSSFEDSCWGFYGDPESYLIQETKSIVDDHSKKTPMQHLLERYGIESEQDYYINLEESFNLGQKNHAFNMFSDLPLSGKESFLKQTTNVKLCSDLLLLALNATDELMN